MTEPLARDMTTHSCPAGEQDYREKWLKAEEQADTLRTALRSLIREYEALGRKWGREQAHVINPMASAEAARIRVVRDLAQAALEV